MSIIPVSRLSQADLLALGNNIPLSARQESMPCRRKPRSQIAAVNRSLKLVDERVTRLHRPLLTAS